MKKLGMVCGGGTARFVLALGVFAAGILGSKTASAINTITVNTTAGPVSGRCNITDAIQAATTNVAVRGCRAGRSNDTDVIQLAANTTYTNYSKALFVPTSGTAGPLTIQGVPGSPPETMILAPDYLAPAAAQGVCGFPVAFAVGGNVTLKDLHIVPAEQGMQGICQYAGNLALNNLKMEFFHAGAVFSWPITFQGKRTVNVTSVLFQENSAYINGGAMGMFGNVDVTVSTSRFNLNFSDSSGAGMYFGSDGSGKMGNLSISDTNFTYNSCIGFGGGLALGGDDANSAISITRGYMQQNDARMDAGGIYVDPFASFGVNKIKLINHLAFNNSRLEPWASTSLNGAESVYQAVWCQEGSIVELIPGEWTHTPMLKGDGTCTFTGL